MTDHRKLIARLEALVDRDNQPDWEDVVRRSEGAPAPATVAVRARRSRRSYLARRLVPVFVLAAALIAVGLIAPWQHGRSFSERALAAIETGPVIHAVLQSETGSTYVDLATGEETSQIETTEIWYDSERRLEHWRATIAGRLQFENLQTLSGAHDPKLDPALAGFVDGYRSALENGSARTVGTETINGRNATWIEFALFPPSSKWQETERVAVDESSSLPLRIERYHDGRKEGSADVVSIETLQEGSGDFSAPKNDFLNRGGRRDHINPVSLAGAVEAIPNAVWTGERFAGLSLFGITRVTLTTEFAPGSGLEPRDANGVEIHYGNGWRYPDAAVLPDGTTPDGRFVWLEEATTATSIYSIEADPNVGAPPVGSMLVSGANRFGGRGEQGLVFENGVYVYISASDRDLLLAAARALEPIPTPAGAG
jgi:hypothetical protein